MTTFTPEHILVVSKQIKVCIWDYDLLPNLAIIGLGKERERERERENELIASS